MVRNRLIREYDGIGMRDFMTLGSHLEQSHNKIISSYKGQKGVIQHMDYIRDDGMRILLHFKDHIFKEGDCITRRDRILVSRLFSHMKVLQPELIES